VQTQPDQIPADRLPVTDRTGLRRMRERGTHDRAVVDAILDEGLLCHVGVNDGGTTVVTPMAYARIDDALYLHGAPGNRTLRLIADGAEVCVTVTLLDALVLARSAFHHSMNYRCVMLYGTGAAVEEAGEKVAASAALLEHMASGRSGDARMPTESELRSTLIVRFPIGEGSAKIRTGGPKDDDEDLDLPIWAGQIPFDLVAGPAVPADGLPEGTVVPAYATRYPSRRRAEGASDID
jgi:nitroimidazol reductase NimA-like FMN-containing flavoprotein (pyridoxamine 5'-phosphate oxidase superfamily)